MSSKRVSLIGSKGLAHWNDDDELLLQRFKNRGVDAYAIGWNDEGADRHDADVTLIRSTWDYMHDSENFGAWLQGAAARSRLLNPVEIMRWNLDKHYLDDLADKGVPVVPTHWHIAGEPCDLATIADAHGWDALVVKPVVGGGGYDTYKVFPQERDAMRPTIDDLAARRDLMIQPFIPAVERDGELSIIVIGDTMTHAVWKTARPGEFRVQDDHGGNIRSYRPTAQERAVAEQALAAVPQGWVYARVDLVQNNGPHIMELEMVEPELFHRFNPESAERLVDIVLGG